MNTNTYIYILIMAGVTYAIRVLPLTLIRKQIKKPKGEHEYGNLNPRRSREKYESDKRKGARHGQRQAHYG